MTIVVLNGKEPDIGTHSACFLLGDQPSRNYELPIPNRTNTCISGVVLNLDFAALLGVQVTESNLGLVNLFGDGDVLDQDHYQLMLIDMLRIRQGREDYEPSRVDDFGLGLFGVSNSSFSVAPERAHVDVEKDCHASVAHTDRYVHVLRALGVELELALFVVQLFVLLHELYLTLNLARQ